MMRNGVFTTNGELPEGKHTALREWLVVLHETLPASWDSLRMLVTELLDNFIYVVKTKDYLVAVLDDYPPDQGACAIASSAEDAGADFACGVWDMLHVVSLGAVQFPRENANAQHLSTERVARTIKDSIANFHNCKICEKVFSTFSTIVKAENAAVSWFSQDEELTGFTCPFGLPRCTIL